MASKTRLFSWSKARQPPEPYHRTGGLLSIDTSVGDTGKQPVLVTDTKSSAGAGRRRPPNLNLSIPSEYHQHHSCRSPAAARHNAALVSSANNLLAIVNDMLRSPALSGTLCPRSAAEIHKPLPSRPRSLSLPSTPELPAKSPVELPGSILLENQGFPSEPAAGSAARSSSTMRSARSGNSLSSSAAKPTPSKVPRHQRSFSETSQQRRSKSKPNLITSPSSTESKITTCSVSTVEGHASSSDSTKACVGAEKLLQPSPLIVEGKPWRKGPGNPRDEISTPDTPTPSSARSKQQIEELKATITAQDNTISTLQAQFSTLRTSHDAHVTSLADSHSAEVASLRNYTRVLEEQQSQRTLHHASSNHLLLLLDTTEPQSPSQETPQTTAGSNSATSIRSFKSALEQQSRSPRRESPEMENLKRKLSSARRPETGHNRDMIRELNQYKQNNAALQKQIESLMAKLNQSKKNERSLTATLEEIERNCNEYQEKARKVEQLEKGALALQNTIDHLEYRLEMANCEKVDAEEQLLNLHSQRSPFDPAPPKLHVAPTGPLPNNRQSAHTSMSTVFSSGSPTSHHNESQDPSTLAAFISHIERLQEQIKQRDERYAELEQQNQELRTSHEQLESDLKKSDLQADIQTQLLRKTKESETHIEQLRTAIIDRESLLGEKEKALRMAERQLEHHKLLLHAEVRKHAVLSLYTDSQEDPLPELSSLTSKEDVDRWISRLQTRLKKEKLKRQQKELAVGPEAQFQDLKQEVDFYVREIVYYKLDIKGYKSDIKKLKHIALRMGSHGSRASDIESPTPSQGRSETPFQGRFPTAAPAFGVPSSPSPVSTGPISTSMSVGRPTTPLPPTVLTPDPSPVDTVKDTSGSQKHRPRELDLTTPWTPQTPSRKAGVNVANEADNIDPGISPRSVARLSPERRKPTPPSPDQEKFGELATNFPLSTPAAPQRHDTQRSMSESIIQLYAGPRTPKASPTPKSKAATTSNENETPQSRQRSASLPDPSKGRATPERPPRPQYGLYESPIAAERAQNVPTPPCTDIMAKALRSSPERAHAHNDTIQTQSALRGLSSDGLSSPPPSAIPAPLNLRARAGSAGSSTSAIPLAASPRRQLSNASTNNVPFVIGMPSPHNLPALVSPAPAVTPTVCSITGKSASVAGGKNKSSTIRSGLSGTMASSTPLGSPADTAEAKKADYFGSASGLSSKAGSATHSRNASINSMSMPPRKDNEGGFRLGGHSRTTSGSGIRSAMQLPGSMMKGKGKTRKDSISRPTPLASPFDIDRGSASPAFGIGEAI